MQDNYGKQKRFPAKYPDIDFFTYRKEIYLHNKEQNRNSGFPI